MEHRVEDLVGRRQAGHLRREPDPVQHRADPSAEGGVRNGEARVFRAGARGDEAEGDRLAVAQRAFGAPWVVAAVGLEGMADGVAEVEQGPSAAWIANPCAPFITTGFT